MTPRHAVLVAALLSAGCAHDGPRMRLLSSDPQGAAWSFVVEDRGRAGQILIDGRPRVGGCNRAGVTLRCELRGLFPGGHTLELRLAGGVLRRSAVLGAPWSPHPVLVRGRDLATITGAGHAGADGVVLPAGLEPAALEELVEAAHKGGVRALVELTPSSAAEAAAADVAALVERYALDGVVGAALPSSVRRRFPAVRAFAVDDAASRALAAHLAGEPLPLDRLRTGDGLVETRGAIGLGLAILAGRAAIIDGGAFVLLGARKRHRALREGRAELLADDGQRRAYRMAAGGDAVTLIANGGAEAWSPQLPLPPVPIDLLGGPMSPTGPTVPPRELAVILASPDPDRTRY